MSTMRVTVNSPDLISTLLLISSKRQCQMTNGQSLRKSNVLLPCFCILITAVVYLGNPKDSFYKVITFLSQIISGTTFHAADNVVRQYSNSCAVKWMWGGGGGEDL